MTDSKCSRCEGWFDPSYEEHDFAHIEDRTVEALERLAEDLPRILERMAVTLHSLDRKIKATPPRIIHVHENGIADKEFTPTVNVADQSP